ncbi:flavin reductase family protein [Hansschlegelia sp. KR7-227]|uniref:flavin reductase family protein n=1 Tax=Hansschlegelia sp. KR7-227 TaxID=3400914 RepID=UPI003C10B6BE
MNVNQEHIRDHAGAASAGRAFVDGGTFREIMRKLAGSVTVITTEGQGALHGFTATAVCSVCAEPPTILIVVNRSARTHPHIDQKGAFAVNILADDQVDLANLFASKSNEQFATVRYVMTPSGVPVIKDAAAFIECRTAERVDVGTHTIFIGSVVSGGAASGAPLIYHDASYARPVVI